MVSKKDDFSYADLPNPRAAMAALKAYSELRARDNREAYRHTVAIATDVEFEADGVDFEDLKKADELIRKPFFGR